MNNKQLSLDEVIECLQNFKKEATGNICLYRCQIDIAGYDEKGIGHTLKSRTKKIKEEKV